MWLQPVCANTAIQIHGSVGPNRLSYEALRQVGAERQKARHRTKDVDESSGANRNGDLEFKRPCRTHHSQKNCKHLCAHNSQHNHIGYPLPAPEADRHETMRTKNDTARKNPPTIAPAHRTRVMGVSAANEVAKRDVNRIPRRIYVTTSMRGTTRKFRDARTNDHRKRSTRVNLTHVRCDFRANQKWVSVVSIAYQHRATRQHINRQHTNAYHKELSHKSQCHWRCCLRGRKKRSKCNALALWHASTTRTQTNAHTHVRTPT